jgi:PiT family inorganic phosphate transporter
LSAELVATLAVIFAAMAFDFTNGFHDAANAIATSISTRALTPRVALAMAAVGNFIGTHLGAGVAATVGEGLVKLPTGVPSLGVVFAGVLAAIAWNLITWWFGLPSSSSHALFGGLVGATFFAAGGIIQWHVITSKVLIPMVLSPLFGFAAAFAVMLAIMWIFRRRSPSKVYRGFRLMQTLSAAALALGHGLQDAQKTMGVIFLALVASDHAEAGDRLPLWVVIAAASAISLGTYSGGWRIMRTLGRRIIHLDPARGFSAEAVGATVLYTTAFVWHAPISTTHTITSAIMGAGATKRFSAVRWGVARSILVAWVSTFPAAGAVAALVYVVLEFVFQLP